MSDIVHNPLKAIRRHCVECSGGSAKGVGYCTSDGTHATRCDLWPYRFGRRPRTAAKMYGERFLDPAQMPDGQTCLDDLSPVRRIDERKPATKEGRQRIQAAREAKRRREKVITARSDVSTSKK